jgi:hypothetical protein
MITRGLTGIVAAAMASLMSAGSGPGIQIDGQVLGVKHLEVALYPGGTGRALANAASQVERAATALRIALERDSAQGSSHDASAQFDSVFDALDSLDQAMLIEPLETVTADSTGKFAFTKQAPAYVDVVMSYDRCSGRAVETHTIKSEQVSGRMTLTVEREAEKCGAAERRGG